MQHSSWPGSCACLRSIASSRRRFKRANCRIAASLEIYDRLRLCGRYWGALEHHPALHFETCYYQVIEFCIAQRIPVFEGGAQGEHKMARGLMPVETRSAHWLAHPQFAAAV